MKEVAKQASIHRVFEKVVMTTVSQNPDLGNIQKELAAWLGLDLPEGSKEVRACRLAGWLKHRKKLLIAPHSLSRCMGKTRINRFGDPI